MSMESRELAQREDQGKTIQVGYAVTTPEGYVAFVDGIDDEGFASVKILSRYRIDELSF